MKKVICSFSCMFYTTICFAQNTGIGTATPKAFLNIPEFKTVLFGNDSLEAGTKLMWLPLKAAIRGGKIIGTEWNTSNIGMGSVAFGVNNIASGVSSTAFGENNKASGYYSMAVGVDNNAVGYNSFVFGNGSSAAGSASFAAGFGNNSNAHYSTTMGYLNTATGIYSVAAGYSNTASGPATVALGYNNVASGDYSIAIGSYVSTNNQDGSFVIGDNSTSTMMLSPAENNFRARFANGYRLYTSSNLSTSCSLGAGDNAWSTSSDVRLKENFAVLDGESFLNKIALLPLGSWNYKKQDPLTFRHYGPMAQDFFAAFGKDEFGTIGNDTSINQADFLGVNLIAIQALEKRTKLLTTSNKELKEENADLKNELDILQRKMKEEYTFLNQELKELRKLVASNK